MRQAAIPFVDVQKAEDWVLWVVCPVSAVVSFEQVATLTMLHTALNCLDRAALVNRPNPLCPLNCNRQQQQQHKLEHTGIFCHNCLFLTAHATCLDVVKERQPAKRQ